MTAPAPFPPVWDEERWQREPVRRAEARGHRVEADGVNQERYTCDCGRAVLRVGGHIYGSATTEDCPLAGVEEEPPIVIQERCLAYRCDEPGACRGRCTCPCHLMEPELVEAFARGLRGEPTDRCGFCGRWLKCPLGSIHLPRHNYPGTGRRCLGSGALPAPPGGQR